MDVQIIPGRPRVHLFDPVAEDPLLQLQPSVEPSVGLRRRLPEETIRALGENMGLLSLYQWEAYNSYLHARKNKPNRYVPVLGANGLLAQIGCRVKESDTRNWRNERAAMREWRRMVKKLWPTCPNELAQNDTVLVVRAGHAMEPLAGLAGVGARPESPATVEQLAGGGTTPGEGVAVVDRARALPPAN